jgi:hypothetical protein
MLSIAAVHWPSSAGPAHVAHRQDENGFVVEGVNDADGKRFQRPSPDTVTCWAACAGKVLHELERSGKVVEKTVSKPWAFTIIA